MQPSKSPFTVKFRGLVKPFFSSQTGFSPTFRILWRTERWTPIRRKDVQRSLFSKFFLEARLGEKWLRNALNEMVVCGCEWILSLCWHWRAISSSIDDWRVWVDMGGVGIDKNSSIWSYLQPGWDLQERVRAPSCTFQGWQVGSIRRQNSSDLFFDS